MRFSTSMFATSLLYLAIFENKGMEVDNIEWALGMNLTSVMWRLASNRIFIIVSCGIFIILLLEGWGTWHRYHGQNAFEHESNAKKIVDKAIYEFHKPKGQHKVEIVFVHGLQVGDYENAYWKTWCTRDQSQCWPQTWLKTKFVKDAWILSLCYDSNALKSYECGNTNSKELGEKILLDMMTAGIGQGDRPIVFVCHSLGGLIIKEVVLCASKKSGDEYCKLLNNIRAFFFYGTPHSGSNLHNSTIMWPLRSIFNFFRILTESSMVKFLEVFDGDRTILNSDFITLREKYHGKWKLFVVAEGAKTRILGGVFNRWVVPKSSAMVGVEEDEFYVSDGVNHFDICKPKDTEDGGYLRLVQCIKTVLNEEEDRQRNHEAEEERRKRRVEEVPIELLDVKPIGIEKKVEKIKKHLEDYSIVALVGMGGVGKSTLSLQTFNSIKKDFVKSYYVAVERNHAQDVSSVQKKFLRDLCKCRVDEGNMTPEDLIEIKNCFQSESESMLVVMDDVKKPLEDFQVFEDLGSKCKLVVTTRDQTHLQVYLNDNKAIVEKVVGIKESGFDKKLFYSYAFRGLKSDHEKIRYKEIGDKIVERCGGLPLSLKVIGQSVSQYNGEPLNQRKRFWDDIYEKLCDAEEGDDNNKLWSSLEISYNSLGVHEKELFLDCACMWRNKYKIDIVSVYENIYGPSIVRNLENRFLINIDRSFYHKLRVDMQYQVKEMGPRLVMHEQLRDMGRRIAKRANKVYKSFSNKDIIQLGNPDFKTMRGLSLIGINADLSMVTTESTVTEFLKPSLPECFSEMKCLWFNQCNLSLVEDCLSRCSPKKLSWLCFEETDDWLYSREMDERDREQSTRSLIDILRPFYEMRVLHLYEVMNIPQSISSLKNLKVLEISSGLEDLPKEIGHLQELRRLNLFGCIELLNIPSGVGKLSKLEYLNLSYCYALQSMCNFEVGMDSLQELILVKTGRRDSLEKLKGLANLRMLQTLDLSYSSFRKCDLPGCLEMLLQLRRLFMRGCHEDLLQEVAKAFRAQELRSASFIEVHLDIFPVTSLPYCPDLIDLRLRNRLKLQEWPDLFVNMPNLQVLHLLNYHKSESCYNGWRELPMSFGDLVQLKVLYLGGFGNLEEFPESIKNLRQLENIRIEEFSKLLRLPVCLKSFEHLRDMWISNCPSIKWEEPGQQALLDMPSLKVEDGAGRNVTSTLRASQHTTVTLRSCEDWDWDDNSGIRLSKN